MPASSVSIPLTFLQETITAIVNPDELHVSLTVFRLLSSTGSDESPIAERTIINDDVLRKTLRQTGPTTTLDDRIFAGLELAVGRSTFLRFVTIRENTESPWYYGNSPVTRAMVAAMQRGSITPPRIIWDGATAPQVAADPPNAFKLYEQNIGPLTPIVADQITTAANEYPSGWIEDAIGEAVSYNKRSWRYIQRILENWRQQGRSEID